jgi:hypothetical protein
MIRWMCSVVASLAVAAAASGADSRATAPQAAPAGAGAAAQASTAEDASDRSMLSRVGDGLAAIGHKTVSAGKGVASWVRGLFQRKPSPQPQPTEGPTQTQAAATRTGSPAATSSRSAGSDARAPAATEAAAAPARQGDDPCRLLTAAEVGVVMGAKVTATRESTSFACRYSLGNQAQVDVSLSSPANDPHDSFERRRAQVADRVEISDIGELAYGVKAPGTAQVHFLKGQTLVEVRVSRKRSGSIAPLEEAKLLARTAASRVHDKPGWLDRFRRKSSP